MRSRGLLNDQAEHYVADVRVVPLSTRLEIQGLKLFAGLEQVADASIRYRSRAAECAHVKQRLGGDARQSRGVREQVVDGDLIPRFWPVGQVLTHAIGEHEHSALLQQEDGGRCELLTDRAQAELRSGRVWNVELLVGQAKAPTVDWLTAASHQNCAAEPGHANALSHVSRSLRGEARAGAETRFGYGTVVRLRSGVSGTQGDNQDQSAHVLLSVTEVEDTPLPLGKQGEASGPS